MLMATSPLDAFKLYYEELPSYRKILFGNKIVLKITKRKRGKPNARKS